MNERPCGHPWQQKNGIETFVEDMLQKGIIRTRTSSYASHAVMFKIHDGPSICAVINEVSTNSWKDKFHVPISEDLLDELHGSTVF